MNLRGRTVGIIVAPGFDDSQVVRLVEILRAREAETRVISTGESDSTAVAGMRGSLLKADMLLSMTSAVNLDAIIIPGGNSTAMIQTDPRVLILLLEMHAAGKPVGAVANGSAVLVSAGLVAGRRVTGDIRVKTALEEGGGVYLDQGIVVDHNMVTIQSESNLTHFIDAIAFLLEPAPTLT